MESPFKSTDQLSYTHFVDRTITNEDVHLTKLRITSRHSGPEY